MTANNLLMNPLLPIVIALTIGVLGLAFAWQVAEQRGTRFDKQRRDAQAELLTLQARLYEKMIDMKTIDAMQVIESAVRLATTGTTDRPAALVQTPEPDARQILSSRVVEETIANGMIQLRELYARAGVPVPDDGALREEVEVMLGGGISDGMQTGVVR